MTEELRKLWEEIKDYVITNSETYELELIKNAPKEIEEKFLEYINAKDDEVVIDNN